MSGGYREYLELFEYFGRGGMVRLGKAEFEELDAEFRTLIAERPLAPAELARVAQLKQLLFRDRPRLSELTGRGAGGGR